MLAIDSSFKLIALYLIGIDLKQITTKAIAYFQFKRTL